MKTVYCVDVGCGVDWYVTSQQRIDGVYAAEEVWFDLDVAEGSTPQQITELADKAMWEKWYDETREGCRRVSH